LLCHKVLRFQKVVGSMRMITAAQLRDWRKKRPGS